MVNSSVAEMESVGPEVAIDQDGSILRITWPDGTQHRFHAMWLRDNAREAEFRHPGNDQRLFDITDVPEDVAISSAAGLPDQGISVRFSPEGIECRYPRRFLTAHAYDMVRAPSRRLWTGATHGGARFHDYDAVQKDGQARKAWLEDTARDGVSFLENVPVEEGAILDVVSQFGFVRETNYGKLFEVRAESKPTNLAFTNQGLNVHLDNPYRDPVPGLQLLHCLEQADEGGLSVFIDGFSVANDLRVSDPMAFKMLSRHWVPFRFADEAADLRARGPLIALDDRGNVMSVRYNNRSIAPFDIGFDQMPDFYAAVRKFAGLLLDERFELQVRLEPGQLVLFDNQRVLHGRRGDFVGRRHLQGCYADKDGLMSSIRVLNRDIKGE